MGVWGFKVLGFSFRLSGLGGLTCIVVWGGLGFWVWLPGSLGVSGGFVSIGGLVQILSI